MVSVQRTHTFYVAIHKYVVHPLKKIRIYHPLWGL